MAVKRSVRGSLHRHLQLLHALLQSRVTCAKPCGLEGLRGREKGRAAISQALITSLKISNRWSHRSELVRRDFLLALGDGVEEQVFQARQDARLPSPTRMAGRGRGGKQRQTERGVRRTPSCGVGNKVRPDSTKKN